MFTAWDQNVYVIQRFRSGFLSCMEDLRNLLPMIRKIVCRLYDNSRKDIRKQGVTTENMAISDHCEYVRVMQGQHDSLQLRSSYLAGDPII